MTALGGPARQTALPTPFQPPVSTPTATPAPGSTTVEWQHYQRPSLDGVVQQSSIEETSAPGPADGRPAGDVTRFSLDPDARFDSSGYIAPRVEVYGRIPTPSSLDPTKWPDPVGSVRYYTFSLFLPTDFQTKTGSDWVVLTQWKGLDGGSPPLSIEVKDDHLRLGGTRANEGLIPDDGDLGPIVKGQWTTLTVGMKLSTQADDGWVEVIRDGSLVVQRTQVATMDTVDNHVDPIYLKQGIYQNAAWSTTHVVYASAVAISTSPPTSSGSSP